MDFFTYCTSLTPFHYSAIRSCRDLYLNEIHFGIMLRSVDAPSKYRQSLRLPWGRTVNSGPVAIATEEPFRGVRRGAVTLLEPAGQTVEEATQSKGPSSAIEREILDLLRIPARHPPGIRDLRHQFLPLYSELRIQTAIVKLLDEGLIEMVCETGYEIGFTLRKPTGNGY